MKNKIFLLFFLFSSFIGFSQPISNRSSDAITVQDGNLFAKNSFRPAVVQDTTAGTIGLDSCGKLIFTYSDNSYWLRACSPKRWVKILKTGDVANTIANNGLSKDGDTTQLGQDVGAVGDPAALNSSREIPLNGFNTVFTGTGGIAIGATSVSSSKLNIVGTGSIRGINISTISNEAINASTSGASDAIYAQTSGTGSAVYANHIGASGYSLQTIGGNTGVIALRANIFDANNGSSTPIIGEHVRYSSGGLASNGIGATFMYRSQTTGAAEQEAGQFRYYFSNATHGTRSSAFEWHLVNSTISARKALLSSTGQWTWDGYPALSAQTDSTTYKPIGIDGSGNVVKMANWFGSGGGGTPGGSNTQVQFNDGGAFGGDAGFTFNKTTNTVTTDSLRLLNARINEDPFVADSIRFYGTSITLGTGQSSGNRYSTLTSNKLNSIESNFGISGASLVVQGVANIPTLPIYSRSLYRWIILEWGVNDINSATTASAFGAAYRPYIDTLIIARGWPADRIVILAPSYIDPVEYPTATLAKQQDFRDTTEAIASDKGTKWVDIYTAELFRNPDLILTDGLHPNDYGASIYVNAICNTIGDSVMSTNQNLSINGITEFQRLKLRTVDTANYKSVVSGFDSAGVVVRYTKDQILQNSETLPTAQAASIDLIGRGYFGNITSPTAVEVVQVNGMVKGTSLRATGSSPTGLTGAGMELAYIGGKGFLFAYDRDGSTGQQLAMNSLGGAVTIGTSATPNGTELLYAPVASKFKSGQFNGTIQAGLKDSAVEVGLLSSTIGYIGAYNRTVGSTMRFSINALGGNVMVGGFTDDAIGKLQVKGKLTITTIDSAATPLNMLFSDPTTGEVKKSAVPIGGITTLNTLTAATQTFAVGTANTDFNIVSSGSTHTFNIPDASASNRGLVTTGTQTIAGAKTFNDNITFGTTTSIVGTVTNNDAVAGNIGEEFNSTVSTYTNYSTTATYQNITSITLTAGDWDLSAFFTYSSNSATITAAANAIFVVSTTTASAAGATEGVNIAYVPQAALLGTSLFSEAIAPYRVSISGTTTYYLNTQATFTLGNPQFVGTIRARRVR